MIAQPFFQAAGPFEVSLSRCRDKERKKEGAGNGLLPGIRCFYDITCCLINAFWGMSESRRGDSAGAGDSHGPIRTVIKAYQVLEVDGNSRNKQ